MRFLAFSRTFRQRGLDFCRSEALFAFPKALESYFEGHYAPCKRKILLRDTKRFESAKATKSRFAFLARPR
jgi:hypothetical protein